MCMIDYAEDRVTVLHERVYSARKEHKCDECGRGILPGERYTVERYVYDGGATTHKTCRHCKVVRDWLNAECGGFLYTGVREDIQEHADEGHYGFGVKLLSIGIERRWRRRDGRLWPTPRLPKTTHEKALITSKPTNSGISI